MKQETPPIHVQSTEGHRITIRQPTFSTTDADVPDNPSLVPVVSAFLAWDILDEFGDADKVSLPDRVGKFLKAIYNRVAAEAKIHVEGKGEDQVQDDLANRLRDPLALELLQNFRLIFQLYVPKGQHSSSRPIEMYWGAVYEIVEVRPCCRETLFKTKRNHLDFRWTCISAPNFERVFEVGFQHRVPCAASSPGCLLLTCHL